MSHLTRRAKKRDSKFRIALIQDNIARVKKAIADRMRNQKHTHTQEMRQELITKKRNRAKNKVARKTRRANRS